MLGTDTAERGLCARAHAGVPDPRPGRRHFICTRSLRWDRVWGEPLPHQASLWPLSTCVTAPISSRISCLMLEGRLYSCLKHEQLQLVAGTPVGLSWSAHDSRNPSAETQVKTCQAIPLPPAWSCPSAQFTQHLPSEAQVLGRLRCLQYPLFPLAP